MEPMNDAIDGSLLDISAEVEVQSDTAEPGKVTTQWHAANQMSSSAKMESGGNGVLTVSSDGSLAVIRKASDATENTIFKHSVVALPKTDGSVGLYVIPSEGPNKGQMFLIMPGTKPSEGKGWKAESTPDSTVLVPLFNTSSLQSSSSQNNTPIQSIVVPSKKSPPTILPAIKSSSFPSQTNNSSLSAFQAIVSYQEVTHGVKVTENATSFATSKAIPSNSMILTQSVPDSIVNSTTSAVGQCYLVQPKNLERVIDANAPIASRQSYLVQPQNPVRVIDASAPIASRQSYLVQPKKLVSVTDPNTPRPIFMFSHEAAASLGNGTPSMTVDSTVPTQTLNVTSKPLIKEADSFHKQLPIVKLNEKPIKTPSKNITVVQRPVDHHACSIADPSNKIIPHEIKQEPNSEVKTSTTSGLQNSDIAKSARKLILCYPANGDMKSQVSSSNSPSKDVEISIPLQKQNLTSQDNTLIVPSASKLRLSTSSTSYSPLSQLTSVSGTRTNVKVIMCNKSPVSTSGPAKSLLNPPQLRVIKKPVVSPLVSKPTATLNSVSELSSDVNKQKCFSPYPTIMNVNSIVPDQKVKPKIVLNSGQRPECSSIPTVIRLQREKPATNITLTKLSHCGGTSNKPTQNSHATQQLIGKTDLQLHEKLSTHTTNKIPSFGIPAAESFHHDAAHQSFSDKSNYSKHGIDNANNSDRPIVIDSVFSLASNDCDSEQKEEKQVPKIKTIDSDMKQLEDFVLREFDFLSHFQGIVLPDDVVTDSQIFAPCYVVLERMRMRNMKITGISQKCTKECRRKVVRRKSDIRLFIRKQTKESRKQERKELKKKATMKNVMSTSESETKFEIRKPVFTDASDVYLDTPANEGMSGLELTNTQPGCSIDKIKTEPEMKSSPPADIPLTEQQFERNTETSALTTANELITTEKKDSKFQKFFMIKIDNKSVLIPINAGKNPKAFVLDNKSEKMLGLDKCLNRTNVEAGVVSSQSCDKSPVMFKTDTQNSAEYSKNLNLNSICPTLAKAIKTSVETRPLIKSEPVTSGYGDEPPKLYPVLKVKQEPLNRGYPDENPKKRSEVSRNAINNDSSPPKLTKFDEVPTTQSKEERISSLKELLRQKELELEEMRRKLASEPQSFVDMDF